MILIIGIQCHTNAYTLTYSSPEKRQFNREYFSHHKINK